MSVCLSVCDGSALWSRCMPGTQRLRQPAKLKPSYNPQQTWPPPMEGSSRAMLATARPSCNISNERRRRKWYQCWCFWCCHVGIEFFEFSWKWGLISSIWLSQLRLQTVVNPPASFYRPPQPSPFTDIHNLYCHQPRRIEGWVDIAAGNGCSEGASSAQSLGSSGFGCCYVILTFVPTVSL